MASDRALALGLAAALLFAGAAASVAAQEPPRPAPTPHPFGQLNIGVASFTPMLQLRNIGFDSNVLDLSGTEPVKSDFTATVEPGVETRFTTPRLDARLASTVALTYYREHASERAISPNFAATVDHRLSGALSLYGKGNFGFVKERTGFEIDTRPRRLAHSATAGVRIGQRKIELDLHGTNGGLSYERDATFQQVSIADTMNHTFTGGGAGVKYRLSPYTSLTGLVDATATRFEFSPIRDTNSYLGVLGVEFHPRAMISGSAGMGYRVLNPLSNRTPAFSGLTPRAGLTYTLRDILTISGGAQRDVEYSVYGDRPYFVYTLYEGSMRQALFHHLDIGGSLQYTTMDYQQFVTEAGFFPSLPTEVVRMATASLGVPMRRFRVGWYVQRWDRVAADRPYKTMRAGLELSVGKASVSPRGVFLSGPGR
jgi:hypothetical protein